jgi:response regulator RpfG family c-di-GMP phosphodiesterase
MTDMIRHGKATILVVDDNLGNIKLISELLTGQYKVKVANNGERALKIAQSEIPPDLIFLDIMMPKMDGYEVCQQLKFNPSTCDIPIIFLTAKSDVEDEKYGLELGAVDYITKPISPPILLARVKTHLALKAATDFLRDKNYFLEKEVQKRDAEIVGLETGVFVHEIDIEELNTVVSGLTTLLMENDILRSYEYIAKHLHLLETVLYSDFEPLQKAVHDYDFSNALKILNNAVAQLQTS